VEDDWTTPVAPKLDLLARVQPSPTQVRVDKAGKVIFFGGRGGGGERGMNCGNTIFRKKLDGEARERASV